MTDEILVVKSGAELAALPEDVRAIKGDGLEDADLAEIGRLGSLAAVYLDGCMELSDAALALLSGLPDLAELYISGRGITDDGLAALATCTKLSEFGLDAPVTGRGFRHFAGLTGLAEVHLPMFPGGTREGIAEIAALPALKKLCFYGCKGLSDSWLDALSAASSLENLVLMNCPGVTDEAVKGFRSRTGCLVERS